MYSKFGIGLVCPVFCFVLFSDFYVFLCVVLWECKYCSWDGFCPQVGVFEEASVVCAIVTLTKLCV